LLTTLTNHKNQLLFGFQRPASQPLKPALQQDGQHTQVGFDCQYLFSIRQSFYPAPTQVLKELPRETNGCLKRDSLSITTNFIMSKEK
jgi:hypothetical protein